MLESFFAGLAPLQQILLALAIGLPVGFLARFAFSPAKRKTIGDFLDWCSLRVLLSSFVIEAIIEAPNPGGFVHGFIAGFVLPMFALVGAVVYKKLFSTQPFFTKNWGEVRFISCTYGGGNRGTMIFTLLFMGTSHFNEYLLWYAIIDLGNFACLLLVISLLITKEYGLKSKAETKKIPEEEDQSGMSKFLRSYLVTVTAFCGIFFAIRYFHPSVDNLLHETLQTRKLMFSAFLYAAIAIRFNFKYLTGFVPNLLAFGFARLFAGLFVCVIAIATSPNSFAPVAIPICISVVLLTAMPPSSMLPSMVQDSNASAPKKAFVNDFTALANLIYVAPLLLALTVAVIRAAN